MGLKEGTQFVKTTLGPTPVQYPLNGNSSPTSTSSLGPREPSSINDHFVSWQPHFCRPFSPQDHNPGPSALKDFLERTFKRSLSIHGWSAWQVEGLSEMDKDLPS